MKIEWLPSLRRSAILSVTAMLFTNSTGAPAPNAAANAPLMIADFEGGTHDDWKAEGNAFGIVPATSGKSGAKVLWPRFQNYRRCARTPQSTLKR